MERIMHSSFSIYYPSPIKTIANTQNTGYTCGEDRLRPYVQTEHLIPSPLTASRDWESIARQLGGSS